MTCRKGNSILWRNAVPTKRGSRKWQGQLWVVVAVVVTDMSKRQLHTVEERRADKKRFKEKARAALVPLFFCALINRSPELHPVCKVPDLWKLHCLKPQQLREN
eukprot:g34523.t1